MFVNVGCPGYLTIAKWQANIRIEVVDPGNQQIYLPAFPHSTPIVNLNLTNFPGRPGGSEIKGENTLDMCLYDGETAFSTRAYLRFEDDGLPSAGRAERRVFLSGGAVDARRMRGTVSTIRSPLPISVRRNHETVANVKPA